MRTLKDELLEVRFVEGNPSFLEGGHASLVLVDARHPMAEVRQARPRGKSYISASHHTYVMFHSRIPFWTRKRCPSKLKNLPSTEGPAALVNPSPQYRALESIHRHRKACAGCA